MRSRIGEVIETNTTVFVAQCYTLHSSPPFGSLVYTFDGDTAVFGVVSSSSTESTDPGRRIIARGMEANDFEDIYRDNPQIPKLLRTIFNAFIIGHKREADYFPYLPACPPRIHSFVYQSDQDQIKQSTQSLDFLSYLLNSTFPAGDEIVCAFLRQAAAAHDDRQEFLVTSGKQLALLLNSDLTRLNAILRRIRP